jgi:hypothetical protein
MFHYGITPRTDGRENMPAFLKARDADRSEPQASGRARETAELGLDLGAGVSQQVPHPVPSDTPLLWSWLASPAASNRIASTQKLEITMFA